MSRKRRAPNMTERLAATLLQLKRNGEWVIPEPLRSSGDAKAICAHVEWDHKFLHTFGGNESPQNMQPLTKLEHKAKTRLDRRQIAKANRVEKKHEEMRRKLLEKADGDLVRVKPGKRKRRMAGSRLSGWKQCANGKWVRRSAEEIAKYKARVEAGT